MTRSETHLLTFTVTFAVLFCGALIIYLAAYARVTTLGIQQSQARVELHGKRIENQLLRANLAALKNPYRIAAKAQALGLTQDSRRVDYIAPPPAEAGASGGMESAAAPQITTNSEKFNQAVPSTAGSQVANNGPTTDDNFSARND